MQDLTNGALILEGGGMRGAFTTGVLDFFLDKNIIFNRVYGVSAGACHACSYLSRQKERAFRVVADYINDSRYMKYSNVLTGGDLFPAEFVYHTIPEGLDPFDYKTFKEYQGEFYAVVTNCSTGEPEYLRVKDLRKDVNKVRASASLPLLSRFVEIDGKDYLDGGMTDSIPVKKALADGAEKCVVILTREFGYAKEPSYIYPLAMLRHPFHNPLGLAMKNRHEMYNNTMDFVEEKEAAGEIFVLRPLEEKLDISRLERNRGKLEKLHAHGYETAAANYDKLMEYLGKDDKQ
ncbi:MAG: patatin family protein [Clostridia bacterium]